MSTNTTKYGEKVRQGNMMYGVLKHQPEYPNCLSAEQIREKYGDKSPIIKVRGRDGEIVKVRRSQT